MPEALIAGVGATGSGSTFITQLIGLFNIFVGLMLVAAFMAYGTGFVMWVTRLGSWPSPRDEAIHIMLWAPSILFTLVVLLAIVQFLQAHPTAAMYIVAAIVMALVLAAIIFLVLNSGGKEEEE